MEHTRHTMRFGKIQSTGQNTGQVEEHDGEVRANLPRPQPFGFAYRPTDGSATITFSPDGDADSSIIAMAVGESPIDLDKGDSIMYNSAGMYVHCEGGKLRINGEAFGGLAKLPDLVIAINAIVTAYNTHSTVFHGGANLATALVQAALENTDVTHG